MSIPKEPRQLMINLMYLVLTAMLALNVSAEVMNAFFDLDKSLKKSNELTANSVEETKKGIQPILEKKPKLRTPLNAGIDDVRSIVTDFVSYLEGVKDNLIDQAGNANGQLDAGDYADEDMAHGKPKGKKNKDVTTRILVNEGVGTDIETKIAEVRQKLIDAYTNTLKNKDVLSESKLTTKEVESKIDNVINNLTLAVDKDWQENSDKKSWAEYKFLQMPLAATLPAITKIQTDARNAEATIVNKIAELVGGREIKFDKFFPVINAEKGYIIKGEPFKARVSLGAYSSDVKDITLSVNGQPLRVNNEGVAEYSTVTSSTGKKTLNLKAIVVNPLTNERQVVEDSYEYEVGVRSASVSADKMNVFYIGVDNPISVTVAGASSNAISVNGQGCSVRGSGGKYTVTATRPGDATITVSGGGLPSTPFNFRVKRIPDPVPALGAGPNKNGGAMGNGEFKAQLGLAAILENFDFDARCNIQGFELTRVAKRQDPVSAINGGARYSDQALRLVRAASPGDTYYFDNIKAKCPGDSAGRKLPSIVFKIR